MNREGLQKLEDFYRDLSRIKDELKNLKPNSSGGISLDSIKEAISHLEDKLNSFRDFAEDQRRKSEDLRSNVEAIRDASGRISI